MAGKTITAISTAEGAAGLGVIRISGDEAIAIADSVFKSVSGKQLSEIKGYTALFGHVYSGDNILDEAVALLFKAPKSYTGEDVVEFSVHGGAYIQRQLVREVLKNGAYPAENGEFTKRAFLNGKLDLAQAESVNAIISAGGEQMLKAAINAKDGAVSKKISSIRDEILSAAACVAAFSDYPDEEPEFSGIDRLPSMLTSVTNELVELLNDYDTGRILRTGVNTVIVGKPNVGKSTLMNLLVGDERSIVTDISGTTRDVIEEDVNLGGVRLHLSDTAGITDTDDVIEKIGVDRSLQRLKSADLILAVFDSSKPLNEYDHSVINEIIDKKALVVLNKSDLKQETTADFFESRGLRCVVISAKNSCGKQELIDAVKETVITHNLTENSVVLSSERQRNCAERALNSVSEALHVINSGFTIDAASVCIDEALSALYELTGERVTEAVANEVFKNFCVGK